MTKKLELYQNGKYVGDYTLVQICRMLAVGRGTVLDAADSGGAIGNYHVKHSQTAESQNYKMKALEEWDEVRFRLNPNAKR